MKTKTPGTSLVISSPVTLATSGIYLSDTGLTIDNHSCKDDLLQAALIFSKANASLSFWTSDLLAAAEKAGIGEAVAAQLGFDFAETKRALAISSIDKSIRRIELTPEHHFIVGRAGLDNTEKSKWLDLAVVEGLSATELAKSIKLGRLEKTVKRSGFQSLSALKVNFFAWKRQFEANRRVEDLSASEAGALLDEMEPILEFAESLANLASQMEMEMEVVS